MFILSRQSRPEVSGQDLDPIPRLGRSAAPRDNRTMPGEDTEAHHMPDPSVQGLGRVARLLGADAVGEVRRLGGNVGCAVHRVELLGEKCPQVVVVKRFPASTPARYPRHSGPRVARPSSRLAG
jgi:hypothetical protein